MTQSAWFTILIDSSTIRIVQTLVPHQKVGFLMIPWPRIDSLHYLQVRFLPMAIEITLNVEKVTMWRLVTSPIQITSPEHKVFCFRVCIYCLVSKIRRKLQQILKLPRGQKEELFNNTNNYVKARQMFDKPSNVGGGFDRRIYDYSGRLHDPLITIRLS